MVGDFRSLYGNDITKNRLAESIRRGNLPHALIIRGPRGSGRHTLSYEIAAALNCEAQGFIPCGGCPVCRRIYEGQFTDLKILTRPEHRATLGVEDIRDFREDMFLSATEAVCKVYIIEDAESMTKEAQNALLKVFEEPPDETLIILLCESTDRLLSTIISRAQLIQMEIFSSEKVKNYLLERRYFSKSDSRLDEVLLSCAGVIGRALDTLDEARMQDIREERETVLSLISALLPRVEFSQLYSTVISLPSKREDLKDVLARATVALRDLITLKVAEGAELLFFTSAEDASPYSERMSLKRLYNIEGLFRDATENLDKNAVIQTLLTDLALSLSGL